MDALQAVLPFDAPPEAQAAAEEAIGRAAEGAGEAWLEKALTVIGEVAEVLPMFTTDEVWERMEDPGEPRAMGAAMRAAQRRGLIESTGLARPSTMKTCHGRPKTLWRRPQATTETRRAG